MKAKLLILALLAYLNPECQTFDASSIRMYWKDNKDVPYRTFERLLKTKKNIEFITGVGKFRGAFSSIGLYIENGHLLHPIKRVQNSKVNREIQPSGVFQINSDGASIAPLQTKRAYKNAIWAIQSGPMLLIDGRINAALPNRTKALRNGVGIKKDGKVLFACMEASMREFAKHFQQKGCLNALILESDHPDVWYKGGSQKKFNRFGPMIVAEKQNEK
jgi:uncharacterized protein YigE (DUF2233 family)